MKILVADIEADGLLDTVSVIHQITTYDPDTKEWREYSEEGTDNGTIKMGITALAGADFVVMHNGLGYDLMALRIVYPSCPLRPEKIIDTLVLSRLARAVRPGGHSLAAWAERFGKGFEKVENEDWSKWTPEMARRCKEDVRITAKLWKRFKPMFAKLAGAAKVEHTVAWEACRMNQRGFTLDVDQTHKTLNEKMEESEVILEELQEILPPIWAASQARPKSFKAPPNRKHWAHGIIDPGHTFTPVELQTFSPKSRLQVAIRLKRLGWRPKKFTPTGLADTSAKILRALSYPEAQKIADYLDVEKAISQINSEPKKDGTGGGWLHHLQPDGRVHPSFNPTGANTHRSSCSAPNLQQVDKTKPMRRCWIPKPGWTLVGVDASGLELRCLAHYLAKYDGGEYGRILIEEDIHEYVRNIVGFYDRDRTKTLEYAWLYGGGDAKLGTIVREDAYKAGHPLPPKPANTAVGKKLRSTLEQGIPGLGRVANGVKAKASSGKLKAIDGRTLWVRSPHSALNLLLQSCGAIVIKTAWALMADALEAKGLRYGDDWATVIQVHDEWQIEARPEVAEEVGAVVRECITKAGEVLGFRCPLDGSTKIGSNWAETH